MTPGVLSVRNGKLSCVQSQISATMTAFHRAQQQGFRLQDVGLGPLAKRRALKKSTSSSGSTDSNLSVRSHVSGLGSNGSRPLSSASNTSSYKSAASRGFTPLKRAPFLDSTTPAEEGYFSFKDARVNALTPTFSQGYAPSEAASSSHSSRKRTAYDSGIKSGTSSASSSQSGATEVRTDPDEECIIVVDDEEPEAKRYRRFSTIVID